MDRDLAIRVKGHLYEIRELDDEIPDSRQGFPLSETGYEKILPSFAEDAGAKQMGEVAKWIKNYFQKNEERPLNLDVAGW